MELFLIYTTQDWDAEWRDEAALIAVCTGKAQAKAFLADEASQPHAKHQVYWVEEWDANTYGG